MQFKEITLQQRANLEQLLGNYGYPHGDTSFVNAYTWRRSMQSAVAQVCGITVLRYRLPQLGYGYLPLLPDAQEPQQGAQIHGVAELQQDAQMPALVDVRQTLQEVLDCLMEDARSLDSPLHIICIKPSHFQIYKELLPHFGIWHQRAWSDYIFSAEQLGSLKGHKYQQKRNHFNKFKSLYDFEYRELTPNMAPLCIELHHKWQREYLERINQEKQNGQQHEQQQNEQQQNEHREQHLNGVQQNELQMVELQEEAEAISEALNHFEELGLIGGALFVNGTMVAFTYGSLLCNNTFCVHIEKCDTSYEGIFAAINKLFVEHLPKQVLYLDREEDMGLPGLRFSKSSYHPLSLQHRYVASQLSPDMLAVRELWLEAFPEDTPQDAEEFLFNHYSNKNMLSIPYPNNPSKLASMLHIIPFGNIAYIYAVATAASMRGSGLATKLMGQALEKCRKEGFGMVALIPSNERNRQWYKGIGFVEMPQERQSFVADDEYDFGTGNREADIPLFKLL